MEASASAPTAAHIEPEPREWQPRALWVSARMLCGSISFFFVSFLFAYFYLRSLDENHAWKIGAVHPSLGLGTAIMACLVLSAVIFAAALIAVVLAVAAVVLQCIEYTTLGFGPASGGYASVFLGWTAFYALFVLFGAYWIETQIASLWRARREGIQRGVHEGVPSDDVLLLDAGIESCSFYWAYFVAIGVIAYVVLYLV
jgi:heme/copper-type cytochrome/quinol oxidase subunit 3